MVTYDVNREVSTDPASLHQAIRSTGLGSCYKAGCSAVIGWFFHSCDWRVSILDSSVVPLAVHRRTALRLLCFLVVGIHAPGIFILLSLLILVGWSLMRIASSTLRVCQRGSRSINLTSFQYFKKNDEHFSSPTTTSSARINFGWQFSDDCKKLFLVHDQVKIECHVTCPSL